MKLLTFSLFLILLPWMLHAQNGITIGGGSGTGTGIYFAVGTGTAQAQLVAPMTAITNTTLSNWSTTPVEICWVPIAPNSGAGPTLAGSGSSTFSAHAITKLGGASLAQNDIVTTQIACVIYNGGSTNFELQNPNTTTTSSVGTVTHTAGALSTGQVVVGNAAGDLKVDTAANILTDIMPTPTRAGDIFMWNGSSWTTCSGNNSGTQFLQETAVGVCSWAASATSPALSSVTAPVANTAWTMGTNLLTLNYANALSQNLAMKNTTAATVGASQSGPIPCLSGGRAWTGSDVEACATVGIAPGNGVNAPITVNHLVTTTSTGAVTDVFSGAVQSGATGGAGGGTSYPEGTCSPSGTLTQVCSDSTLQGMKSSNHGGSMFPMTQTICSGQITANPGLIASGAKSSTLTLACTGLNSTTACAGVQCNDNVLCDFSADPTGITGYAPTSGGILTIFKFPTLNTINVILENNTAAGVTPGSVTLNCKGMR